MFQIKVTYPNGNTSLYSNRQEVEDAIGPNAFQRHQILFAIESMTDNVFGVKIIIFKDLVVERIYEQD